MSPEELDKARVARAFDLWHADPTCVGPHSLATIAARLAREGWTPPDPISPRVLAAREWLKGFSAFPVGHMEIEQISAGTYDHCNGIIGFLAGFEAAVELASPVLGAAYREIIAPATPMSGQTAYIVGNTRFQAFKHALQTYRQSIGDTPHEGQ